MKQILTLSHMKIQLAILIFVYFTVTFIYRYSKTDVYLYNFFYYDNICDNVIVIVYV